MSQGPYKTPQYATSAPQNLPQGLAVSSMVCGILSLTLCGCFTAIPAVICGYIAMQQADQGRAGGKGMAVAGLIMGAINLVMTFLAIILYVVLFGFAIASEIQ